MPDASTFALFVAAPLALLLGGTAGDWIGNKNLGLRRAGRYVTGGVYIALGAVAAISGKD
jgi:hypothetical protein